MPSFLDTLSNCPFYAVPNNIKNIQNDMDNYFQWRKFNRIKHGMKWTLWGFPILISMSNLFYAAYIMNYPTLILFREFILLLPLALIGVSAILLLVGLLIHPVNSHQAHLVSKWYETLKSQGDLTKKFTDKEIGDVFWQFWLEIITDKEKSQRFLQVVNLQDQPYDSLCMVFKYDWQQALNKKYQEKVNSEKEKVFQLLKQLENRQKELESESSLSQYRLFIGNLDTMEELEKQQEFLKNAIIRTLSGENLDWQNVLPQKTLPSKDRF